MGKAVEVPLSVGSIKQLTRQLQTYADSLREGGKTVVTMERTTAADIVASVVMRIAGIADVDGNYLGTDNANASVAVEVGLPGHDAIWRGNQIAFVEFGTGAAGTRQPYPDAGVMARAGYSPDPTKEHWWYPDAKIGRPVLSKGMPAYAPMYGAAVFMREIDNYSKAKAILVRAGRDAITV